MKPGRWAGGLGAAALLYLGLPTLWVRGLGLGVVRNGRSHRAQAALTFEGGPDPQVTPPLLAALQEADVRATFFLDAGKAERHPELVGRLRAGGHELGLLLGAGPLSLPWRLAAEPGRARDQLGRGGGGEARWVRPAGGLIAWPTLWGLWRAGLKLTAAPPPGEHLEPLLTALRPGRALTLPHGTGAVTLLPELLVRLKERGYQAVPLAELIGLRPDTARDLAPKVIGIVDVLYDALGRIERTGQHASSLFRVGSAAYPLEAVTLPGGLRVERGERLAEFHLDSARLTQLAERPMVGRHAVKHSLHDLAEALRDDPAWEAVPAAFSISIFSDLLRMHGFQTAELPSRMQRRLTWWSRTLRRVYGVSDLRVEHLPRLAIISRAELIRRFGQRPASRS
ncbi:YkoP family protein [Deinococcus sp.]|uniref:YkoP family protein n=1 Tax=Deinococcus sp. TaxID=47478 RepID=UPI003CC5DF3D